MTTSDQPATVHDQREDPSASILRDGAARPIDYTLRWIADAGGLREHLDALNEAGQTPVAVGVDSGPQSFLITLVGPYAESEDVFFDSPWQGDIDYGERVDGVWVPKQPRCEDCRAMSHGIEDLRFPVVVLGRFDGITAGSLT
jgi:hypothetical protein